jgi:hypothetical protein
VSGEELAEEGGRGGKKGAEGDHCCGPRSARVQRLYDEELRKRDVRFGGLLVVGIVVAGLDGRGGNDIGGSVLPGSGEVLCSR